MSLVLLLLSLVPFAFASWFPAPPAPPGPYIPPQFRECHWNQPPCAAFYSDNYCSADDPITSMVPDCSGKCYKPGTPFNSISVGGILFLGTDCHIFSDTDCQNEIKDSQNIFNEECFSTPKAQSVICYYDC
ncbi:hypothetical protein NA57DRAFT_73690 [Rhizodiscina lignyota]|uniref:ShKT domain-containing protein n=1 Tax=Rhizodiscina lignyota TaxID=1504668 RepID=A0A9P4IIN0_9PEZI|nr:hypothetical protein NA57DRAFT_73690 [Rhizodiscina lignyota]